MSTLASVAFATDPRPVTPSPIELDGRSARALAAALPAFAEKAPGAKLDDYSVHVNPPADGTVQVVFEPRQPEGQPPALGGRSGAGPEVNVWVRTDDYAVDRVSLAR